ncbi:hypothetical protein LBMAG42_34040 [Deltaproteobacteria bacterium]|nr:hypothetical protein LBMAG42_34040 [Deltaproteobacteria bacterium]
MILTAAFAIFELGCVAAGPALVNDSAIATEGDSATLLVSGGEEVPEGLCEVALDCWGDILDEPKGPCDISIVSESGVAEYEGPAAVELHGRSSLTFPKPQYSVELRSYTELLVWPGATWAYLDDGSDPGAAWMMPGFDDSAWSIGAAPLGYGGDWLNTMMNGGSPPEDVRYTTYFRRTFSSASLTDIAELELGILRNDAVAVFLNGTEVLRENLDEDANYRDHAELPVADDDELRWLSVGVAPGLLVEGPNVLAVELHQAEADLGTARFDLYFDASGAEAEVDLFGMGAESDWSLNGMYVDRALLRNKLAFDVFASFGGAERYAPESRYCELTLNGDYRGIYALGERIKRASSRLDLAEGGTPGDSFIIKLDDEEGFHENAVGTGIWQMVYPEADNVSEAQVEAFLVEWEGAIRGADPTNPESGVFAQLDLSSAVDWVILQELTKNVDAYQLSVYLWRDDGGSVYFAPWDFDLSMGYPYYDCGATNWIFRPEFVTVMAADPAFRAQMTARWAELRQGALSDAALARRIAAIDATLAPAIDRNFERWPIEEIVFSTDELDNWLCPVGSYEEEHARVIEFLAQRLAWMDANLVAF